MRFNSSGLGALAHGFARTFKGQPSSRRRRRHDAYDQHMGRFKNIPRGGQATKPRRKPHGLIVSRSNGGSWQMADVAAGHC